MDAIRLRRAKSSAYREPWRTSRSFCKPEVAGSIPARSTPKGPGNGAFLLFVLSWRHVGIAAFENNMETAARRPVTPPPECPGVDSPGASRYP
jgi:hypothetical protein